MPTENRGAGAPESNPTAGDPSAALYAACEASRRQGYVSGILDAVKRLHWLRAHDYAEVARQLSELATKWDAAQSPSKD